MEEDVVEGGEKQKKRKYPWAQEPDRCILKRVYLAGN